MTETHRSSPVVPVIVAILVALVAVAQAYDEASVRYILADMALGGPVSYYRAHTDEDDPCEAVGRYDDGVRCTNSDDFERKIVDGSWRIVYSGTTTRISGTDVRLTGDTEQLESPTCNVLVVSDFVFSAVKVTNEDDEDFLEVAAEFAAKKAIGKLVSMGVKELVGLASQSAGVIAGHATGFFLTFINMLPTAGIPTRIDRGFLMDGDFSTSLSVERGAPVFLVAFLQPGDELDPISLKVTDSDGSVVFTRRIEYDDISSIWEFDNRVTIISSFPLRLSTPGQYRFGKAKLQVE